MEKVVVFGGSNVDFVFNLDKAPEKGETLNCNSFNKLPGGKGANQAFAVQKLGGNCIFLSAVGRDELGDIVLGSVKSTGVDVDNVLKVENESAGMAIIYVESDGDNRIVVNPGANLKADKAYVDSKKNIIESADYVLTQFELDMDATAELLEIAKKSGKTIVLNPAPAVTDVPDSLYAEIDYLTPNETELKKLTGLNTDTEEEIEEAAKVLLAKGVKNLLVTIGSKGAMLINENGTKVYPGFKVDAVDTTAAGDTFNAGFIVGLSEGMEVEEAIRFANAAASITVTRKGAQPSIPSREEVNVILK